MHADCDGPRIGATNCVLADMNGIQFSVHYIQTTDVEPIMRKYLNIHLADQSIQTE